MNCEEGFVVGIVTGLLIGVLAVFWTISVQHHNAVRAGHAEYYVNTNNFDREWRWKECK